MTKTTFLTILLTTSLLMTTGYVAQASALELTFTPISTPFNSPIGIDHFAPTNEVVMSVHYGNGLPYNFETVASDGLHAQFSLASGLTDEVKIATARDDGADTTDGISLGGFAAGTLFTGNGLTGQIAKINPDATIVNPWVILPGGDGLMRGSLYVDRTGIYGGDLIVVTTGGQVWRIDSSASPTLITDVNTHLEGLVTVPSDPVFGGLSGKIIAGAEDQSRIYAFDNSGLTGFWSTGSFQIEDIDLIPENENFFGVNFGTSRLLGVPASSFDSVEGEILITDEFSPTNESGLALLKWDSNINAPIIEKIGTAAGSFVPAQWEHVTFSSAGIVEIPPVEEICGDGIDNDGDGQIDEGCNEPPVAVDDSEMTDEDTSVIIDVLTNDSDPNGDALTIIATTAPANGSIVDNGDGTITYAPNSNYNGPDSFTYTITDGEFDSTATVTIDVKPVNDAPVCSDASIDTELLWPPNHKFKTVTPEIQAADIDGNVLSLFVVSVFQDEPVDDKGDGKTSPDAIINDDGTVDLRAERSGNENGRVYHITVAASDGEFSCEGITVTVGVPHNKKGTPVDDGANFDSTTS